MYSGFRPVYVTAWLVALCFAGSAFVYKYYYADAPERDKRVVPDVGALGSAHAHVSLLVMDRDNVVSFCTQSYMLASQLAHFEDDDCVVVHKHATGVTLDTFLRSIEVSLADNCLAIPNRAKRCNDGKNTLRAVVNGEEVAVSELQFYELQNNDHVLINYGPESGSLLRFKYNQVPRVPPEVNVPKE